MAVGCLEPRGMLAAKLMSQLFLGEIMLIYTESIAVPSVPLILLDKVAAKKKETISLQEQGDL